MGYHRLVSKLVQRTELLWITSAHLDGTVAWVPAERHQVVELLWTTMVVASGPSRHSYPTIIMAMPTIETNILPSMIKHQLSHQPLAKMGVF